MGITLIAVPGSVREESLASDNCLLGRHEERFTYDDPMDFDLYFV